MSDAGEGPLKTSWTECATKVEVHPCLPPFSFFFDLIDTVLKAPGAQRAPLHRLCTLARKQGVTHVVFEPALGCAPVRSEIDSVDAAAGGGGMAEAIRVSFLATKHDTLSESPDLDQVSLLGQVTVINYRSSAAAEFTHSYVFEAIAPAPKLLIVDGEARELVNNFIYVEDRFSCDVLGRAFELQGIHYCQQNGFTHVCAHAVLRMALASKTGGIAPAEVNQLAGLADPTQGMQLDDILRVLEHHDFDVQVIEAEKFSAQQYISALAAIIESGDRALLIFTLGASEKPDHGADGCDETEDHVVLVIGHTQHSDEWHPQAIPAYAGSGDAPYYPSSEWIDHFLIHDDNFGPYFTLSSHALEYNPNVSARRIVAIRQRGTNLAAPFVEALAAGLLADKLPSFSSVDGDRWLARLSASRQRFVLRSILVTRDAYIAHLRDARGHDTSSFMEGELQLLAQLPEYFWMVEFSLPALFTGNHSKLGEVIIASHADEGGSLDDQALTLAMRVPGYLLMRTEPDVAAGFDVTKVGLTSHSPILRLKSGGQVW